MQNYKYIISYKASGKNKTIPCKTTPEKNILVKRLKSKKHGDRDTYTDVVVTRIKRK